MPFAYYGAKHGLAPKYPRPQHPVIIEPFAGSAAYSVHHAATIEHAVLYDVDPIVCQLWTDLQTTTPEDLDRIGAQLQQERFDHPLLAGLQGSSTLLSNRFRDGGNKAVTPRMREAWPTVRARIERTIPHISTWQIIQGSYTDCPDIEATWHIDPPYQPLLNPTRHDAAGKGYKYGSDGIDYHALSEWCQRRQGFVMVCEQSPAEWLPFHPFATQNNGNPNNTRPMTELIWRSDYEQPALF